MSTLPAGPCAHPARRAPQSLLAAVVRAVFHTAALAPMPRQAWPSTSSFALQRSRAALVAVAIVLAGNAAQAQTAALPGATGAAAPGAAGELIVVTGTRTPLRVDEALAEVTVIDRAAIEASGGRTLAELLARQSGLQFWSNGGPGQSASVSIRGLEARHTLLLIDGARYGSATIGQPVWDNLPLDAIERIEIVRGPLSALYGSDAVGGVVQIFTRRGTAGLHGDASATLGSLAYRQATTGVRWGAGDFDAALSLQAQRTRGFSATNEHVPFGLHDPDRDGFTQRSANLALGWALPAAWRVQATALESHGEVQYDDGPGVDSRARLTSRVLTLQAAGPVSVYGRSTLRAARTFDAFDTLPTDPPPFEPGVISTVQQQMSWEHALPTFAGNLLVVAESLRQQVAKPNDPFDVSRRTISGLGAGLDGAANGHHWQAALRRDRNSQFGGQSTATLGYGRDLSSALRIGASLGTSYVVPSFNQLYFPGFGSPTLQPEEGVHRELFVRYVADGAQWRGAWFDNRIRGYIPAGPRPANVPRAQIDGVALTWGAQWGAWTLDAAGEWVDARNVTPGPDEGQPLPRRARETLRLAAERSAGAWSWGGSLQHVGPRAPAPAALELEVAACTTLDLRAQHKLATRWSVALSLNNVADRACETVYGYNQPGREAYLTLRYATP